MLKVKPVYRTKEEQLTLYGLPGALVMFLLMLSAVLVYALGWMLGLSIGGMAAVMSYVLLAGKPRHWLVYAAAYLVRGRTVLTAAACPDPGWEEMMAEAMNQGD